MNFHNNANCTCIYISIINCDNELLNCIKNDSNYSIYKFICNQVMQ